MASRWVRLPNHPYGCHCPGCQDYGAELGERMRDDFEIDERLAWGGMDVPS